jgi:hypothetical protein
MNVVQEPGAQGRYLRQISSEYDGTWRSEEVICHDGPNAQRKHVVIGNSKIRMKDARSNSLQKKHSHLGIG